MTLFSLREGITAPWEQLQVILGEREFVAILKASCKATGGSNPVCGKLEARPAWAEIVAAMETVKQECRIPPPVPSPLQELFPLFLPGAQAWRAQAEATGGVEHTAV